MTKQFIKIDPDVEPPDPSGPIEVTVTATITTLLYPSTFEYKNRQPNVMMSIFEKQLYDSIASRIALVCDPDNGLKFEVDQSPIQSKEAHRGT